MNGNGLRWMPLCVSATTSALLAAAAGSQAYASQTHKLLHGETVASIARKHHLSVHDIAVANPDVNVNSVPDGHKLTLPDPPRKIHIVPAYHKVATMRGDRVGLRLGPGETFRRVDFCGKGQKLIVSAQKDGWAQVTMEGGRTGWVRHDFLKYAHGGVSVATARPAHKKSSKAVATHTAKQAYVAKLAKHSAKKHPALAAHKTQPHTEKHVAASKHHSLKIVHSRQHDRHYIAEASRPNTDSSLVRTAIAYRGTPYRYGSTGGGSFDCSGFTRFVYSKGGVSLPHSAKEQFHQGHSVSRSALKPGDLVFFHTVTSGISHVGIYAGNGRFVHASSRRSGGVRVDNLDSGYYSSAFRGARRVK